MKTRRRSHVHAVGLAIVIGLGALADPTSPPAADAAEYGVLAGNAQSSWQTNAPVWTMDAAGLAIYVAGDFTSVRPPGAALGTGEVPRRYVAAFDAATGALLPFAHSFDAPPEVVAGSPDGARIYVGGGFSRVDGQPRAHLAAFDTATGRLLDWAPTPDADVTAMTVAPDGSAVYVGGRFHAVNGAPRSRLAAITAATGEVTPWAAGANGAPTAMTTTADGGIVYVTGYFSHLNQTPGTRSVGALDTVTGATMPFPAAEAMPPRTALYVHGQRHRHQR